MKLRHRDDHRRKVIPVPGVTRKQTIMDALFRSGRSYQECARIYALLKSKKELEGQAVLRLDGREYPV